MGKTKLFGTSLEAKARILVFNIASGLLSLAIISYIFYFSLKSDYDSLFSQYNHSLIELEAIRQIINQMQNLPSIEEEKIIFLENQEKIQEIWENYQQSQSHLANHNILRELGLRIYHFFIEETKTTKERDILKSNLENSQNLNRQIQEFLTPLNGILGGENIQEESLKTSINQLNRQISKIISNNLKLIEIEKERNNILYNILHKVVLGIMCLIMLITLCLSFLILQNIKTLHMLLESKVQEKTKELQNLNNSLQETIEKEVLESRKKDQIMYQQARLASMGEMIGNIAHQWRQPLNALMLLIQTFKVKSQNGKLTKDFIDTQVEDGLKIAKKMSRTIEDFRNFFHNSSQKESFNLKENLEDSISLVDAFLKQSEIELNILCPQTTMLYGYKNAFSQVILNLIKNAQDVLQERKIPNPKILILVIEEPVIQKDYVKIFFMDNAGGVKLDDIQKIFEPYFTTKHKSVGTGIGLYMSKQIIEKQMQGSIEVKNTYWRATLPMLPQPFKVLENDFYGAQFIISIPTKNNENDEQQNLGR